MGKLLRRLTYLLNRRRHQRELREEIEAHRALRQWHLEQAGYDRVEAALASRRRMGAVTLAREEADEAWLGPAETWWSDLRAAVRTLRRHWGFSLTVTLTLALCLGVNAAVFSVVHTVLWRPLSLPHSDQLVLMTNAYPRVGVASDGASVPDYLDRRRVMTVFDEQALFQGGVGTVDQGGLPTRVAVMKVTPSFFRLAEVPAHLGRTFSESEGSLGHDREVILSDALWRSAFGADARVVGRDLRLDGQPLTVIGVMPATFTFLDPAVMCWTPLAFTPQQASDEARHVNEYQHVGRLRSGATVAQAQAELDALNAANLDRFPQYRTVLLNAGFRTVASRGRDDLVKDVRQPLSLIWAGALLLLLVGAVNVTTLVLVRSRARARDYAVRHVLGAGTVRLMRQALTEYLFLTVGSAAIGVVGGAAVLRVVTSNGLLRVPRATEVGLDGVVVGATLLSAAVLGLVLGGLSLAGRASWKADALRADSRGVTRGAGGPAFRHGLVAAQVALAFVLILGAGLFAVSFRHILRVDPGFDAEGVVSGTVALGSSRYPDARALRSFTEAVLGQTRALPDVRAAAATTTLPDTGSYRDRAIAAEGAHRPTDSLIVPSQVIATPAFFDALRIPLKRGRLFTDRDDSTALPVAIVDETLAREFWPGQDPLGRRMYFPGADKNHFFATDARTHWFTVVGVVGDIKLKGVLGSLNGFGTYYFPYAQQADAARRLTFTLRTGNASSTTTALRRIVTGLDPDLPLFDVDTLAHRVADSVWRPRAVMLLASSFSAVALALVGIGIYGVLSFLVAQRRREIGIRIALGGRPAAIMRLIVGQTGLAMGGGLMAGAGGAFLVRRVLTSALFGVRVADPWVLAGTVSLLMALGALAAGLPARRAAHIDPVRTLAE